MNSSPCQQILDFIARALLISQRLLTLGKQAALYGSAFERWPAKRLPMRCPSTTRTPLLQGIGLIVSMIRGILSFRWRSFMELKLTGWVMKIACCGCIGSRQGVQHSTTTGDFIHTTPDHVTAPKECAGKNYLMIRSILRVGRVLDLYNLAVIFSRLVGWGCGGRILSLSLGLLGS